MLDELRWSEEGTLLEVNGARLRCVTANFLANNTSSEEIVLLKTRALVDDYVKRFAGVRNVLEFGVYEGGSPALFAAALGVERYVGIDLKKACPTFDQWLGRCPWGQHIKLRYGTSQDDGARVPKIIAQEFAGRPLDLIVDDASHQYGPTRRAFELAFPFLRPGGTYVIEDWGWAHWPGDVWQKKKQWGDSQALSYLIFELAMASATSQHIISRVELQGPAAYVTKAPNAPVGGDLKLESLYQTQGRRLSLTTNESHVPPAQLGDLWMRERPWLDLDDADVRAYVARLKQKPPYDLEAKLDQWRNLGFVVFPGAASRRLIDTTLEDIEEFKRRYGDYRIPIEVKGQQIESTELGSFPDERTGIKINHLHCYSRAAALLSLTFEVCDFLHHVFQAPPAALQSLTFWRGSEQRTHVDYPYVNAQRRLPFLAAAWIALEDVNPDAGPLGYYPGGHRVSATGFFDWGSDSIIHSEKSTRTPMEFADYLGRAMAKSGIARQEFCPKRGDVFIWHGNLPHEGTPVRDQSLTRKSYVTHYTALPDFPSWLRMVDGGDGNEVIANGGYCFVGPTHAQRRRLPSWENMQKSGPRDR